MLAVAVGASIALYSTKKTQPSMLVKSNIEALTDVKEIADKWFIIDQIACNGAAQEIRIDCSYTNCNTCEQEAGKATAEESKCTKVRPFNL